MALSRPVHGFESRRERQVNQGVKALRSGPYGRNTEKWGQGMTVKHESDLRRIARQAVEVAELIHQPAPSPSATQGGFQTSVPAYDPRARRDDRDRELLEIERQLTQLALTIQDYLQKPTG
jgi:hypothetical protein